MKNYIKKKKKFKRPNEIFIIKKNKLPHLKK